MTAAYSGDASYNPTQGAASPTVSAPTSVYVQLHAGVPATIAAAVAPSPGAGTVDFAVTSASGGPVPLAGACSSVAVVGGQASCTFTPPAAGDDVVSASYSGDALHQPSQTYELADSARDGHPPTRRRGFLSCTP